LPSSTSRCTSAGSRRASRCTRASKPPTTPSGSAPGCPSPTRCSAPAARGHPPCQGDALHHHDALRCLWLPPQLPPEGLPQRGPGVARRRRARGGNADLFPRRAAGAGMVAAPRAGGRMAWAGGAHDRSRHGRGRRRARRLQGRAVRRTAAGMSGDSGAHGSSGGGRWRLHVGRGVAYQHTWDSPQAGLPSI
ncbi:hypothetical protein BAE44_0021072, partial [Dichanthelium oligosanthes]